MVAMMHILALGEIVWTKVATFEQVAKLFTLFLHLLQFLSLLPGNFPSFTIITF